MKDLDFDELDRAVSSLMGDKNMPAPAESRSPVQSTPSTESSSQVLISSESAAAPSSPARPAPAARRGGRFMDMVPTTRKPKEPAPAPVYREGASIQPATPVDTPMRETPSLASEAPSVISESSSSPATDWPDPLELASKTASVSEQGPPSSDVPKLAALPFGTDTELKAEPALEESDLQEKISSPIDEPLSSPFLPDAKVEKRPLGGAALASTGSELMVEDEHAQLPALPKDVEPVLPEELHGDVVSIAADNSTTDPSQHSDSARERHDSIKKDTSGVKPSTPAVTVTEAVVPSGPASIPQQYKEEASSGDQKNGAIYDTDSYHQPLSHPAKKKPGWSWVIWILLILLAGAGSGAALYFLGIF